MSYMLVMRAFATLLDRLSSTASRNAKLVLVRDYLSSAPDPERGWSLAALTGNLSFSAAKPAMIRQAVEARVDPQLFAWSYDYVGDLAETVALIWPAKPGANREPELDEVVDALRTAHRRSSQALIEGWLDALSPDGRWALLKLVTGGLRVGLSARLAKQAAADLAAAFGQPISVADVEEIWHAVEAPYGELFAWLEGRGPRPDPTAPGRFRPVMLAQAVDEDVDFLKLDPKAYAAEWKWDGIRVQAVRERGPDGAVTARLYSRSGEEISAAFPDLMADLTFDGAIDGELLVLRERREWPPFPTCSRGSTASPWTPRLRRPFRREYAPTIFWQKRGLIFATCPSSNGGCVSKTWSPGTGTLVWISLLWLHFKLGTDWRVSEPVRLPGTQVKLKASC